VCSLSLFSDVTGPLIQSGCPDYTIAEYLKCSSTQQIATAARPPAHEMLFLRRAGACNLDKIASPPVHSSADLARASTIHKIGAIM
jgi:hypothetical protein